MFLTNALIQTEYFSKINNSYSLKMGSLFYYSSSIIFYNCICYLMSSNPICILKLLLLKCSPLIINKCIFSLGIDHFILTRSSNKKYYLPSTSWTFFNFFQVERLNVDISILAQVYYLCLYWAGRCVYKQHHKLLILLTNN